MKSCRSPREHRYQELKAEIAALKNYFPELARASRVKQPQIDMSLEPAATIDRPRRKRRRMSPAVRRAVSRRMKQYGAASRAGKKR
jgi:hypothetical protein